MTHFQNYTPGWKFSHWEQKGVPVRIEVGPRDFANKQCRLVRRDNGTYITILQYIVGQQPPCLCCLRFPFFSFFALIRPRTGTHT